MEDKHISVTDWEPGDPIDEEHLAACSLCRRQLEMVCFLRFQAENAPRIEPPPFFAARVARLVQSSATPFWGFVEGAARRLIPIFAALIMGATVLLYNYSATTTGPNDYASVLMDVEEDGELTLDDVIVSLTEPLEEENR